KDNTSNNNMMNIGIDVDDDDTNGKGKSPSYLQLVQQQQIEHPYTNNNTAVITSTTKLDDTIRVNIRSAEDPIVTIDVGLSDTIEQVKHRILELKNKKAHRLRMVYNGRMLSDNQTVRESKLIDGAFIICSITMPLSIPSSDSTNNNNSNNTCLNNITNHNIIINNNNNTIAAVPVVNSSPSTPPIISNVVNNSNTNNNDFVLEMNGRVQSAIILEDDQAFAMSLQTNILRDSLELLFGLASGFFFGPISLFWLSKDYLARNVKFGIVMGVSMNVFVGLTK
ncbi:hypothetical protein SAMD00019534_097800, partial [Acytostelium subglobosum LB1]|uniref:hypothetical protein n=1 Tax=Acytostelium subglobosum LB1 TaxID=1410327 RepID=UPI0006450F6D